MCKKGLKILSELRYTCYNYIVITFKKYKTYVRIINTKQCRCDTNQIGP